MNPLEKVDQFLAGAPDTVITIGLIFGGIIAWLVAIYGRPAFKVAVLAWIVAP